MEKTAEERAAECERRIREVVDSGEFVLGGGYQTTAAESVTVQGLWSVKADSTCVGCALGSLAYALERRPTYRHGGLDDGMRDRVVEAGLCSREEVLQMEMGYEDFASMTFDTRVDTRFHRLQRVVADPSSPFYKLGQRLQNVSACTLRKRRVEFGGET